MVDSQNVTILLALFGGLISFVSPCVLPLVPAYIGYLTSQAAGATATGASAGGGTATVQVGGASRLNVFLHGMSEVAGIGMP